MRRVTWPGSSPAALTHWTGADGAAPAQWQVAEEVPVGILVNSRSVAVMMATPSDLEELAVGFLLAEGQARPADLRGVLVLPTDGGFCVDVALADGAAESIRPRMLEGRSGCGLCGMSEITDVQRDLPHADRTPLDPGAVAAAFAGLRDHQPLRDINRSVHVAGFADAAGQVLFAREDVGRHCALDKLIGALAIRRIAPGEGFAVMSSRCSFELVQKAAQAGLGGLATLSAPTALALRVAAATGLPLAARAAGGVALFG